MGQSTNASEVADLTRIAGRGGQPAAMDQVAAANVAADIAAKTALLVTDDAVQTATDLNAQVPLPAVDENNLAKRAVVATAGDASRSISTYVVQGGDTLSGIASKFNVTTATIKAANDITDENSVRPGQELTILPITGVVHTVAEGETAESLAQKYQANAAQILSYNNAEVKGLVAGQKIIVPDGVKPQPPRPRTPAASSQVATPGPVRYSTPAITSYSGGGNSYSYGYCTWYVANRRSVPGSWGNASSWLYNARAAGFGTGSQPVPGAIAWSSGMSYWGHVGIVEAVEGDRVLISDMNGPGGWGRVSRYWTSASTWGGYIY